MFYLLIAVTFFNCFWFYIVCWLGCFWMHNTRIPCLYFGIERMWGHNWKIFFSKMAGGENNGTSSSTSSFPKFSRFTGVSLSLPRLSPLRLERPLFTNSWRTVLLCCNSAVACKGNRKRFVWVTPTAFLRKPIKRLCTKDNHLHHFQWKYYQQHKYHIPLPPPDSSPMVSRVVKGESRRRLRGNSSAPRKFGKEEVERGWCAIALSAILEIGSFSGVVSFLLPITLRVHAFIEL